MIPTRSVEFLVTLNYPAIASIIAVCYNEDPAITNVFFFGTVALCYVFKSLLLGTVKHL